MWSRSKLDCLRSGSTDMRGGRLSAVMVETETRLWNLSRTSRSFPLIYYFDFFLFCVLIEVSKLLAEAVLLHTVVDLESGWTDGLVVQQVEPPLPPPQHYQRERSRDTKKLRRTNTSRGYTSDRRWGDVSAEPSFGSSSSCWSHSAFSPCSS